MYEKLKTKKKEFPVYHRKHDGSVYQPPTTHLLTSIQVLSVGYKKKRKKLLNQKNFFFPL